jgi:hypothetical protein
LKELTRAQLKVGVLHPTHGLVGEFFLPLKTLVEYGQGAPFKLESRDFLAPRVTPPRPVAGAGGTVILVQGHWQHGSPAPSASVSDFAEDTGVPEATLADSRTASLLARQNPQRAQELVEAVSRAKFPNDAPAELDKVQQFFVGEFGTLRESWKQIAHLGKSEEGFSLSGKSVSPRARAMTLPSPSASGEVALDENEFKVALQKSGYSGNASQVWRQLAPGSQPKSATSARSAASTARDFSVERVPKAGALASGSARSARSDAGPAAKSRTIGASDKASLSRATWAGPESDAEAVLRASLESVFKSVGAGVRAIQKRQAMPTEVRVNDLFEALKKGQPRFGFPELKRLIPGSDRSETVSWVELGLEAEASRPAPQTSIRASVAIEQLSDLLSAAANELRGGARGLKGADGGKAGGRFL